MATTTETKRFVLAKTKANFLPVASNYNDCVVFIADTNEIYTHNAYYGLSKADAAEISKIASIQTELASKIKSVTAASANAVTATTTNNETVIQLNIATGEKAGNVVLTQTADGLSANVDIPAATVTGVKSGDKVLDLDGTELTAAISITYGEDAENDNAKTIFLRGKGSEIISKIDATEFVKDKVVSNAELVSTAEKGITVETPYIKLTFNDESNPIRFSVKSLIDIYTGANLNLSEAYSVASTYAAPAVGDSMDVAVGKLAKGIADAKISGVTKFAEQTGDITVDTASSANGSVKFAMDGKKLTASVNGLGSAAYTEATAYATAAQGTTADTALQGIAKGADGSYVTTTIGSKADNSQTVGVSVTIQPVNAATSTLKGLAESSDVKSYVDGKIADLGWLELD